MPRTAARGGTGWETGEECPHEWGHGSLKGYATVLRRSINELRMGFRREEKVNGKESAGTSGVGCHMPIASNSPGPADFGTPRFGWLGTSRPSAARNYSAGIVGPAQTFSSMAVWAGSRSTSQPSTFSRLISSVVYSASQRSG